jgi:hypothetical protein
VEDIVTARVTACASASAKRGLIDFLPEPLTQDNTSPEVDQQPLVSMIAGD